MIEIYMLYVGVSKALVKSLAVVKCSCDITQQHQDKDHQLQAGDVRLKILS